MFRKTMIAVCAVASIGMLAPDMALARGGGGGGGGGHGGGGGFGGGGHGGFGGGGGFGGAHAAFGGGGFGGRGGFAGGRGFSGGSFGSSFARAAPSGGVGVSSFARAAPAGGMGVVQGGRFAGGQFGHGFNRGFGRHGFHHGRRFFAAGGFFWGPGWYDDYWGYPDYAYDDSYYDTGGCYVVQRRVHTSHGWRLRPIQVCG